MNDIKDFRKMLGLTQVQFCQNYEINLKTLQNWEQGISKPPQYFMKYINEELCDLESKKVERACSEEFIALAKQLFVTEKSRKPEFSEALDRIIRELEVIIYQRYFK